MTSFRQIEANRRNALKSTLSDTYGNENDNEPRRANDFAYYDASRPGPRTANSADN